MREAVKLMDGVTAVEGSKDGMGQAELAVLRVLEEVTGRTETSAATVIDVAGKGPFEITARFVGEGNGESDGAAPSVVVITDPARLIETVRRLASVCDAHALNSATLDSCSSAEWGEFPNGIDDEMDGIDLEVWATHFVFSGESGDGRCGSSIVNIEEFVKAVTECPKGCGVLFPGSGRPRRRRTIAEDGPAAQQPRPVTPDEWELAFESANRKDWNVAGDIESFKILDGTDGAATIFARDTTAGAGNGYYAFRGSASSTPRDIADRLHAALDEASRK